MNIVRTFHPVGQGAFYSERFYEDEHLEAKCNIVYDCGTSWGNVLKAKKVVTQAFDKKEMDEKIVAIKDYLPAFLFDHHKELYCILSLGVHQLDEDDCLNFYPVLYDCIILILDDRLAQREKEMNTKKAAASLSKIMAAIKK